MRFIGKIFVVLYLQYFFKLESRLLIVITIDMYGFGGTKYAHYYVPTRMKYKWKVSITIVSTFYALKI